MSSVLELRHLRLVRAIVEEGGPTRAAARLHLSQSAVSHQLAELEAKLGVPLFARVRRRLSLTRAGEKVLDAARTMLGELTRVEQELYRASAPAREPLRLAVECFTSYPFLPALTSFLAKEHPHVEPRIVLEATREPLAALLRGTLDIALVSSSVRDRGLVTTRLFRDEWTVILPPGHRLVARPFVSATELGAETLFSPDAPRSDVARLRERIAEERAPMPRVVRVPLTDVLVAMVAGGHGVGLAPRWAVAPHVARGEVVLRRFTREALAETWFAVHRRDAERRLPLPAIVDALRRLGLGAPTPKRKPVPRTKTKTSTSAR